MEGDAIGVTITRSDGVYFVPWAQVTTATLVSVPGGTFAVSMPIREGDVERAPAARRKR